MVAVSAMFWKSSRLAQVFRELDSESCEWFSGSSSLVRLQTERALSELDLLD